MKKSDLKTGMILVFRDGDRAIMFTNTIYNTDFYYDKNSCACSLSDYNEDLTCCDDSNFDIIAVEKPYDADKLFDYNVRFYGKDTATIWQRKETKKMTLSEIEAALGYSVEIVSESTKED